MPPTVPVPLRLPDLGGIPNSSSGDADGRSGSWGTCGGEVAATSIGGHPLRAYLLPYNNGTMIFKLRR
jgi:hypothetical protein